MGTFVTVLMLTLFQMWLNLSADECRRVGEYANTNVSALPMDDPLVDVAPDVPSPSPDEPPEKKSLAVTPPSALEGAPAPEGASLFQSLEDGESDSSSESEDELNVNKTNESWATLMLELETLKALAGAAKGKGKKSKSQVVMETPEMVKLKNKINRLEKEYMFGKKDAGECVGKTLSNVQMPC